MLFQISASALDGDKLRDALLNESSGALVTFEGWVRNHNEGKAVTALEYEAYEALALKEGCRIVEDALSRFEINGAICVHRVGALAIGDMAVWVGVTSAHRGEAFAACQFVIDEIKKRVPIWKREHYVDGSLEWVNCAHAGSSSTSSTSSSTREERQHEHAH